MGFTGRQKALQLWALCRRTSRRSPSRPIECLGSPSVLHRRTAAGGQRFRTTYGRHSLEPLSSFSRHALSDDDLLHAGRQSGARSHRDRLALPLAGVVAVLIAGSRLEAGIVFAGVSYCAVGLPDPAALVRN